MRLTFIAAGYVLLQTCLAVFADEAWNVDYHYQLLGEPKQDTTFFHQPNPASRASLVYTLSKKGVVGAVNPKDGSIVWRHLLRDNATLSEKSFLRAGEDQDIVVSGISHHISSWSAADGRQVWSRETTGLVEDLEILELSDGRISPGVKDAIVLSSGERPSVQRLDGATGAVKWTYGIDVGHIPYQVSASTTEIFAIVLHKTLLGYIKIKVISLDPTDGRRLNEHSLSSDSELASEDTIIAVGANSASPVIAWTDAGLSVLKINIIGTKAVSSFDIEKHGDSSVNRIQIHAPHHTNSLAHFLVHYTTSDSHWAEVFRIDLKNSKIEKKYSMPNVAGQGTFATSSIDANVYFTRITSDEISTVSSASHGLLGRWPINGFGVAAGPDETVVPIHAVSELSIKSDAVSAIRTAVLLSTGDWVLLRKGESVWQRPEALAGISSATFATPSSVEQFAHELELEAHSNSISAYLHRITRHIADLRNLPSALLSLPQSVMRGFLGTSADSGAGRDSFGFHQVVACVTEGGRAIALDVGKPDNILWSHKLPSTHEAAQSKLSISSEQDTLTISTEGALVKQFLNATNGQKLSREPVAPAGSSTIQNPPSTIEYTMHDNILEAYRSDQAGGRLWRFASAPNERIVSLVPRPVNEPVASIGKVLGDRRVLYKYLDSNLALLTTVNDVANSATFYVLDTISGGVIHASTHTGIDLNGHLSATMSENWFAYSYTAESADASPKGHTLVVGEMFESLIPNDRGPLDAASNFSSTQRNTEPFTLVQTYQISDAISKMTVTQTRQGITSRQLLAVLGDSQAIVGIPYGVLDPRRPVHRAPTKDEQMEGLMQYTPVIEFDPKWYLNHQREVLGVQDVITSPALIESTSLVFAYGLDIFGTRLTPSFSFDILGKDFNKFQMLATVAALAVATFVVAPLVARKQVNTRWQFT